MADVSIGTVDRVLHNRGEVNQETRNRVISVIDELDYKPNLIAKSLALKKSFNIAILVPKAGNNNPYWKKPAEGFNMAAAELHDFNTRIILFNYDLGNESSFIRKFTGMLKINPDGIILAPHFHDAAIDLVRKCKSLKIPVIYVDNDLEEEPGIAYFGQDAFQSGKVAAKLMSYKLAANSKVIIVNLAPNKSVTHHMQRREHGFSDYFHSELSDLHITTLSVAIDLSNEKELSLTMRKLLSENPDIGGVFVTNSRAHKLAAFFSSEGNDSIMLVGYDAVGDNIAYLKKGVIDLLICQKPQDQGYLSAMAMFNFLFTGKEIERVNYSPIDIIMKENLNYYHSNEANY